MNIAAVFDTGVLLSAIGWGGKPGQCLRMARDGDIDGLTCVEILDELAEKLASKLQFDNQRIVEVIGSLQLVLRPVAISGKMTGLCADPHDDMVLECALVGGATHVISGDKKHLLSLRQISGIPIVSPAELIVMTAVR